MDNLIIMNTIIENQRAQKLNTYMFFADAFKCFDKLWLKDCLLEMYNLGYDPNTLKILYEMNKETSQRSGKTRHNIRTHHVLCRDIRS